MNNPRAYHLTANGGTGDFERYFCPAEGWVAIGDAIPATTFYFFGPFQPESASTASLPFSASDIANLFLTPAQMAEFIVFYQRIELGEAA